MNLSEKQARNSSRTQVTTYLIGNLVKPARMRRSVTELYRAARRHAAKLPSRSLVDVFPTIDHCEVPNSLLATSLVEGRLPI